MENLLEQEITTKDLIKIHADLSLNGKNVYDTLCWHDIHDHMLYISALLSPELDPKINKFAHILGQGEYIEEFLFEIRLCNDVNIISDKIKNIFNSPSKLDLFQKRISSYLKEENDFDRNFNYAAYICQNSLKIAESIVRSREFLGRFLYEELGNLFPGQITHYDDYLKFLSDLQWSRISLVDLIPSPENVNFPERVLREIPDLSIMNLDQLVDQGENLLKELLLTFNNPNLGEYRFELEKDCDYKVRNSITSQLRNKTDVSMEELIRISYTQFYGIHKTQRQKRFYQKAEAILGSVSINHLIEWQILSPYILPQTRLGWISNLEK
jgi:hypothetical protein